MRAFTLQMGDMAAAAELWWLPGPLVLLGCRGAMSAQHLIVMNTNVAGGRLHVPGGAYDPGWLGQAASRGRPGLTAAAGSYILPALCIPTMLLTWHEGNRASSRRHQNGS